MGRDKILNSGFNLTQEPVQVTQEVDNTLYAFDQAFRKFKKKHPEASLWNISAVEVFCKNNITDKLNTLEVWFNTFLKY